MKYKKSIRNINKKNKKGGTKKNNTQNNKYYNCWVKNNYDIDNSWICENIDKDLSYDYTLSNNNDHYLSGPYETQEICNTWCSKTSSIKHNRNKNTQNLYNISNKIQGAEYLEPEMYYNPNNYNEAILIIRLLNSSKNKKFTNEQQILYDKAIETIKHIKTENMKYDICDEYIDIKDVHWDDITSDIIDKDYMFELFNDLPQIICNSLVSNKLPLIEDRINYWHKYLLSLDNNNVYHLSYIILDEPDRFNEIIYDFLSYIK